jgi:hypothetical protein
MSLCLTLGRNEPYAGRGCILCKGDALIVSMKCHSTNGVRRAPMKDGLFTGSRERRKMMKLTPEQQAFHRYGFVKACLCLKIQEARDYARHTYGTTYAKLTPKERADCRKQFQIEFLIDLVRDRRATCRAWVPPRQRGCFSCKYDGAYCKLCALCHGAGWYISWQPKRRGNSLDKKGNSLDKRK